jgi:HEAT repeat protein
VTSPGQAPAAAVPTAGGDSSDHADGRAARLAVVLAGHAGDEATARAGLAHTDAAVRHGALAALHRCGRLGAADLETAFADREPVVRRRAAELAAHHADVDVAVLLDDGDWSVVEMAAWACGEQESAEPRRLRRLAALAADHHEPLVREAAVAALGAIGHPDGLPAILSGTRDKPAVRRRAVLALAPFDGPEVDEALRRAASDRDWQVRQAAEDLLDDTR